MKPKTPKILLSLGAVVLVMIIVGIMAGGPIEEGGIQAPRNQLVSQKVTVENYERIDSSKDYSEVLRILGPPHRSTLYRWLGVKCSKCVWFGINNSAIVVYMLHGHVLSSTFKEYYLD